MIYLLINNLSFLPEQMNNDSMHLLLQLQICNKDESNTIYVGIFQVSTWCIFLSYFGYFYFRIMSSFKKGKTTKTLFIGYYYCCCYFFAVPVFFFAWSWSSDSGPALHCIPSRLLRFFFKWLCCNGYNLGAISSFGWVACFFFFIFLQMIMIICCKETMEQDIKGNN